MSVEKLKFRKGSMPKAQKKRFLKYLINELSNVETSDYVTYAFCNEYNRYFDLNIRTDNEIKIFKTMPEFLEFKPTETFYDCENKSTDDPHKFWFTLDEKGLKQRLDICKKLLKQL